MPWTLQHLDNTDSTNARATSLTLDRWNNNQSADHHAITAATQSAGRGQHDRAWQSPAGGLYLSAILENVPAHLRDKLALMAGVAVCQALAQLQVLHVGLRWPNDITLGYGDDKKVGGILCESLAQAPRFAAIIGIGLNVNSNLADLPPNLRPLATSLHARTNHKFDLATVATRVLASLDGILNLASLDSFFAVVAQARAFDSLMGKPIQVQTANAILAGTAAGLSDAGQLLLQTPTSLLELPPTATLISINGTPLR